MKELTRIVKSNNLSDNMVHRSMLTGLRQLQREVGELLSKELTSFQRTEFEQMQSRLNQAVEEVELLL